MNSPTLDIQQRIEEGALRLFSQYGYIGTSMRMVAKEAYASLGIYTTIMRTRRLSFARS